MILVHKTCGRVLDWREVSKGLLDGLFQPLENTSRKWKHWVCTFAPNTCLWCVGMHGKIYAWNETSWERLRSHNFCQCIVAPMKTVPCGTVTQDGLNGADKLLSELGLLPPNYLSKQQAWELGWESRKGNLAEVAPNQMIGGGIYRNDNGHLPSSPGRVWREADFD